MKKWVVEDWEFELTAISGKAKYCRLGIEKGEPKPNNPRPED